MKNLKDDSRLELGQDISNFIKKETLAQLFSCEFCEISKNILFTEHLWTTASYYTSEPNESYVSVESQQ